MFGTEGGGGGSAASSVGGVRIAVMGDTDLGRVRELRSAVGWTADPLAFDLLRGVREARWAVADFAGGAGGLAGMVGVVPLGRLGIVFHLAVREEARGFGIGGALASWGVAYLRSRGVRTVRLYSTGAAEGLYGGLGFLPAGRRAVYVREGGEGRGREGTARSRGYAVTPLRFGEVSEVCGTDYWTYGGDRSSLILATLRLHRGEGWVARDASGRMKGYLIRALSGPTVRLGPLAAANADVARLLLSAALAAREAEAGAGPRVTTLTVPAGEAEPEGRALLEEFGFAGHPDRMCMELGPPGGAGSPGLRLYGTTPFLAT